VIRRLIYGRPSSEDDFQSGLEVLRAPLLESRLAVDGSVLAGTTLDGAVVRIDLEAAPEVLWP
jgi:hypothetical protein